MGNCRRCARFQLVGSLDRGWPGEAGWRIYQDHELASPPHRDRVLPELRAGHGSRPSCLYWLRFVGDPLMDFFRQHVLTIVALWPLAGMISLMFFNKENKTLIRWWANLVMISGF